MTAYEKLNTYGVSHRLIAYILGVSAHEFHSWAVKGVPEEYLEEVESIEKTLERMTLRGQLPQSLYHLAAKGLVTLSKEGDNGDDAT